MSTNTTIIMPKIGQVMERGTILEWHVPNGSEVARGQLIATIETDKAAVEFEAQEDGILHIHVQEGEEVEVGTPIAEIGYAAPGAVAATAQSQAGASKAVTTDSRTNRPPDRVLASPRAKRLAAERNIDLSLVRPASDDGVISEQDVLAYAESRAPAGEPESAGSDESGRAAASAGLGNSRIGESRPLAGIRLLTARQVTRAWQTIPHIVQILDVDAGPLKARHASARDKGMELSINDLLLHGAAKSLARHPDLNGVVEDETVHYYTTVDIGFAVDTPRGLLVPVIRRADSLEIDDLVIESRRLTSAAREGRIHPDELGQASLTVSNLGMYGIRMGTPVINAGESILVFVGAVEDRVVAEAGVPVVRPQLTLSIAFDHRLTDGVSAAKFSQQLKQYLEAL